MAIDEIIGWAVAIIVGLPTIIQISPIKINPWSWLARRIGRAINCEVIEKVNRLEQKLIDLEESIDEKDAKEARTRILRFGDELLHDIHHSKEHFDEILHSIDEYEKYCDTHPNFVNNMTKSTTEHIIHTYNKCIEDRSFL